MPSDAQSLTCKKCIACDLIIFNAIAFQSLDISNSSWDLATKFYYSYQVLRLCIYIKDCSIQNFNEVWYQKYVTPKLSSSQKRNISSSMFCLACLFPIWPVYSLIDFCFFTALFARVANVVPQEIVSVVDPEQEVLNVLKKK